MACSFAKASYASLLKYAETNAESYVSIDYIENQPAKWFTRPIRRWKLSKEDEEKIDILLKTKKK